MTSARFTTVSEGLVGLEKIETIKRRTLSLYWTALICGERASLRPEAKGSNRSVKVAANRDKSLTTGMTTLPCWFLKDARTRMAGNTQT